MIFLYFMGVYKRYQRYLCQTLQVMDIKTYRHAF